MQGLVKGRNGGSWVGHEDMEVELMLMKLWEYLDARVNDQEDGATMVEYGIMVALIAVIVMIAVGPLGIRIAALFDQVTAAVGG